ncbi:MAG: transketolase [Alphaproteobacteria bacterium]|jgi:transketolase|nr:transketolase [Alphaproteobacteria bacterium]
MLKSNLAAVETPGVEPGHDDLANAIRFLAIDAVEAANSGHPGMPMGFADVATVLFTRFLKFDPLDADWPDRDRFVLSAGHGSALLYACLYLSGYPDTTIDQIRNFRQLGSRTPGHPEYGLLPGVETTTGPLGQGLTNAVGMALAERMLAARFGSEVVDHYTYVVAGDGCLMEGISQEAISFAGHMKLNKLIVLFDDNESSIDGPTALAESDDTLLRFQACCWNAVRVDGHDPEAISEAIAQARRSDKPTLVACRTIIGRGAPNKGGTVATHGAPLGKEEAAATKAALNWTSAPFEVPEATIDFWRTAGARNRHVREAWLRRFEAMDPEKRAAWDAFHDRGAPPGLDRLLDSFKSRLADERPAWATRKSGGEMLKLLTETYPQLIGGSADLTGSNLTKTPATTPISAADFGGRYIYYGVREHAMAAMMNGIVLHGGFIPYGGSFFTFTDYCRPAIRLSALMHLRVIYVMTHDSIGIGEDGPTHQPVEQLAALRAIADIDVFRPADAIETAECWALALQSTRRPSVLVLTRQSVPAVRVAHDTENLSARGGYVLAEAEGPRDVTLIATGSEVHLAVAARKALREEGIAAAVVSLPCWEKFDAQPKAYREAVLGDAPRVAAEAASTFGWTRYVESEDDVIGLRSFGVAGPAPALFEHFGITADGIAERARGLVAARRGA